MSASENGEIVVVVMDHRHPGYSEQLLLRVPLELLETLRQSVEGPSLNAGYVAILKIGLEEVRERARKAGRPIAV